MAPKGVSAEEKRVRLLEIFHESKDFYQLKELEKLGPKLKGIVSQSVKEVLQGLVDDGLVQADKIGSSNFFWSFPSQQGSAMQAKLQRAKETNETLKTQKQELQTTITAERSERPVSEERTELLAKLTSLKKQHLVLQEELAAYGNSDPVKVEQTKRAVFLAKEAAMRWTDNYCVVLSHFTRETGVDPDDVRKYLEIGEDYEDIY
ncbi:meiotic nuclear division protein 1 [Coprinopsis marcescibilis]|uniref:Meiotic nuclear division protein 1 n=1 Tax=Coprinopsis marcescibilis TaxID=230819 RepID=A0A5C3KLZ0_COPMA|nr:meiotic nuclear division protein 1 [Coprinopsis marcescibilis]